MNKLKQKLKVGLASLLLLSATVAAQAQTFWSDMGSEWAEPAARAFDGYKSMGWSQKSHSGWIGGKYDVPVKFNTVEITTSMDGFNDINSGVPFNENPRAFKDWVLKGSNDTLAGWVTLDTRTNETFKLVAPSTRVTKIFTFANEVAYTYYRFEFVNNGNMYTQMGELALSYNPNVIIDPQPQLDMFWSNMGSEWGEPAARAFDSFKSTYWSQRSPTGFIGGKFTMPAKFNRVLITTSGDGYYDPNSGVPLNQNPRAFKNWILKGSNDTLMGWTTLDTRTGELFEKDNIAVRVSKEFSFSNEIAYQYYRFEFINNGFAYTQMGELAFSYVAPVVVPVTDMFWSDLGTEWGEPASKAFDGAISTDWSQKSKTGWIGGRYVVPQKFNTIEITTALDGFNVPDSGVPLNQNPRAFKDWVLKGSNDTLVGWTTLDTRTNELFINPAPTAAKVTRSFTFTNETAYTYYRFDFTNNGNSITQMSELAFSYVEPPATDIFWSDKGSPWGEPATQAFDNDVRTNWSQQSKTGWIGGKYVSPVKCNTIVIFTGLDGFNDPNSGVPLDETPRAFKDWVLKGSNDTLTGWVTLDTRTNEKFKLVAPATQVSREFTFTNEVAYKYYRFYYTNNGDAFTQLGQISLYYIAPPVPEIAMFWSDKGSEWGEPAVRAFDAYKSSTWSQRSPTGWISGKYFVPVKYNRVDISTGMDGFNDPTSNLPLDETPRAFKDWVLKGSNDTLAGWVTLDTRTNEKFKLVAPATRVTKSFTFANETAYTYYRFEFINNGNQFTQMGELAFSYEAPNVVVHSSNMGSAWNEPATQAFDGLKSTMWSQNSATGWVGSEYTAPVKYNTVELTTGTDGFNDPNSGVPLNQTPRTFKNWVLKGSNDTLAGWEILDTRTGELFIKDQSAINATKTRKLFALDQSAVGVTRKFSFTNETAYKYYRLEFTNNGNTYTQMGELTFSYELNLPLSSLVLSGTESNGGARLVWNTTGEVDVKSFEIFKKNAAGAFVSIGKKASKGNGDNAYSFFDANASVGDNYYQVKNIDLNGGSSASNAGQPLLKKSAILA